MTDKELELFIKLQPEFLKRKNVKMTGHQLMNEIFLSGLQKLIDLPMGIKVNSSNRYWIGKIGRLVESSNKALAMVRNDKLLRLAEKDEQNKPRVEPIVLVMKPADPIKGTPEVTETINDEQGRPRMQYVFSEENNKKFQEEMEEQFLKEIEFPFGRIKIDLSGFPEILTTQEMLALDKIIEWVA
jgi:hypothetical protein